MFNFTAWEMKYITSTMIFIQERHKDQFYGDLPYWNHCVDVATRLEKPTVVEFLAALLHDTVEDTKTTLEEIETLFGPIVAEIVGLLTKNPDLSYKLNINAIAASGNVSAMKVKMADNQANFAGDKSHMTRERRERLMDKYGWSMDFLEDNIATLENTDDV